MLEGHRCVDERRKQALIAATFPRTPAAGTAPNPSGALGLALHAFCNRRPISEQWRSEMNKSFAAALAAISLGLSLPAWAGDADPAKRPAQAAQSQPEQKRVPAAKEATPTAGPAQAGATSETAKSTESDQTAKSQSDQAPAQKHPPTAAMDKATPEKSSSETGAPAKHPPAASMERATPEQKSPGSAEAPKVSK
jgi:hypothetical protein